MLENVLKQARFSKEAFCVIAARKKRRLPTLVSPWICTYNAREMPLHSHPETIPDDDLLIHIGEGCSDCFTLLFHRYFRQVFAVSFRILRDKTEAEDVLQDVFLAIYTQRERFDPVRGSVRTWILQFAYFKALLRRRYLRIRNFYSQQEVSETREVREACLSQSAGMSPAERLCYVEAGVRVLNPKQRQVIELVHFEGYTLQECSQIVRESLANTRNLYYRGLKVLRSHLHVESASKERELLLLDVNGAQRQEI